MTNKDFKHEHIFTKESLDAAYFLRYDPSSYVTKHWHESIEIIYILEGSAVIFIGDETLSLNKNDCIVINTNIIHSSRNINGNKSILLQIPTSTLNRYLKDTKNLFFDVPIKTKDPLIYKQISEFKSIILKLKELMTSKPEGYSLMFTSILFELLFYLYQNFRIETLKIPGHININKESTRLLKVLEYTNKNYKNQIKLSEISNVIYLQPEYFCRYFKKHTGVTYIGYLNELRLSYIYKDLVNSNIPLKQILQNHGFKNYKLFRKLFYERFNCTPGEMRAQTLIKQNGGDK